jgi:hypothetical protein
VHLDREAEASPGEDDGAHDQVVRQRRVWPAEGVHDIPNSGDVGLEIALELSVGELGKRLDLKPLVAVRNEDRQQAADVGDVHRDPVASPDPVKISGAPVLAEQVHFVSLARQRLRQARVVDVGSRPAQQVTVEDQDAHGHNRIAQVGRC